MLNDGIIANGKRIMLIHFTRFMAIFISILVPFSLFAEQEKEERKSSVLVYLPLVFYTPETGLSGGAMAIIFSNLSSNNHEVRPSKTGITAFYTQKKQYKINAYTETYLQGDNGKLHISSSYSEFPDKFWGIGQNTSDEMEESYTLLEFTTFGSFLWKVYSHLQIGPYYRFSRLKITETEKNGLLDTGNILGSDGTTVSGAGIEFSWDTRDNIFWPLKGNLLQLRQIVHRKEIRSNENFSQMDLDFRQFVQLFKQHVFAIQYKMIISNGDVPFQLLPKLGGSTIMRGCYEGRYIDKNYIALQGEYRLPIYWRFSGVLFGSVGQVAPGLKEFNVNDAKTAYGVGIRYAWIVEQKVNIRLDVGISDYGIGYYLKFQEAF